MASTKRCCTCGLDLPLTAYNRRTAALDGLQARCRTCSRRWYEQNRAQHIANVYRRNVAQHHILVGKVARYLTEHPCVDCGERDVRCLEFDHRDRAVKTANVATLLRRVQSWDRVLREIEKCDVRCANCHKRKTAAEDNSWRHRAHLDGMTHTPG
jgi:hypothetical protein